MPQVSSRPRPRSRQLPRWLLPAAVLLAGIRCAGGDGITLPAEGLPAAIAVVGGNGQSGVVGQRLTDSLIVRVTDSRGRPVESQKVLFQQVAGGTGAVLIPDTAVTDADGRARAVWVLGHIAGAQRVEVRVLASGASGALKATFDATALAAQADTIIAVKGDSQVGVVGGALADSLAVAVTDQFGNPVPGQTVTWTVPAGQGSVSAGTTTTGSDGRAAVRRVLGPTTGTQTTTAVAANLPGQSVVFISTANAGRAAKIVKLSPDPQAGPAGQPLPDSLRVQVQDANGNGVAGESVTWVASTGGSTSPSSNTTDATGRAATAWTLSPTAGANTLTAAVMGVPQVQYTATGNAGTATALDILTQPSATAQSGSVLATQPSVGLRDASGNAVPQSGVSITATVSAGATLSGGTTVLTSVQGVATFTNLALTAPAGSYTLTFSVTAGASGIPPVTSSAIQLSAGQGTNLTLTVAPPATGQSGVPLTPATVVQLRDAANNPVSQSGVAIHASIAQGAGGTLGGTDTVLTDASGVASFGNLIISGPVGDYTLRFDGPGLTGVTALPLTLGTGPAAMAGIVTQPSAIAQNGIPLPTQPVVQLEDGAGNPVALGGVSVTAAIASGGGTLGGTTVIVTGSNGQAAYTNLVLNGTVGPRTLSFTPTGLTPALSGTISLQAGTPVNLLKAAGDNQTATAGSPVPVNPTVKVTDDSGNAVAGVTLTFAVTGGGGSIGTATQVTDVSGQASVGWTLGVVAGTNTLQASATLPGGTVTVSFTATGTSGSAGKLAINTQPSATAQSGVPFAQQPMIQLQDVNGNPVSTANVAILATVNSGSLGGNTTALTNSNGQAAFTNLSITGLVGTYTITFAAVNVTGVTSGGIALSAGAASKLAVVTQPSATAQAGVIFPQQPVVQVQDDAGNPVASSGRTVVAAVNSGPSGSVGPTGRSVTTNAAGTATYATLEIDGTVGSYTLLFSSANLTSAVSAAIGLGAGPATQMSANSPTTQSATVGTAVASPPSVLVADAYGNPVAGVAVTFAVTAGGGSLNGASQTTNASGVATVTSWTLGMAAGGNTVTASAAGLSGSPVTFNATGTAGAAAAIALNGGDNQTAVVNTAVAVAPSVKVTDAGGNPVSGVSVTFAVATGGGSGTGLNATTNTSGVASVGSWILGTTAGTNTLTATASGLSGSPVTFSATAIAGTATTVTKTAGDGQSATVGTAVAIAPQVRVTDQFGNPVANVAVTFTPTAGGGQVTGGTTSSNSSGLATVGSWTLGTVAGTGNNSLQASISGASATFTASALAGPVDAAHSTASVPATGTAGSATAITIQARDQFGNPLGSGGATFVVSVTGANTATPGVLDNNNGTYSASYTPTVAGTDNIAITLASTGISGSPFTSLVGAGSAASVVAVSPTTQSATVGTAVTSPPSVEVTDGGGNPVSGVSVTFAVASGGGSVTGGSQVTNASGIATVTSWTLGTTAGTNTLTATAAGVAAGVTFTATGTAGSAAQIAVSAGDHQSATVNTAVAIAPSALVTDQFGNPVAGVTVTFTPTAGGGQVTGATPTSGSNGIATMGSWTLGTVAGTDNNTLQASIGTPSVTFTASAVAGPVSAAQSTATVPATGTAGSATAITIQARDQFGNPLGSGGATFVVSVTGANTATPTVLDNGNGTYSTSYTPTVAGTDNIAITLASTGISGSPFTSLVGAGSAGAVVAVSPTTQSATVGTAVTSPPSVKVTDANGNAVVGAAVTFAVTAGGGNVTGGSQVTNASGVATVTSWTLGTTAGANTLSATATGVATGVTFTATGTAGPVSAAQSTATVPPTGTAGSATAITIQARDQFGNPLGSGGATFVVSVTGANTATPTVLDNGNGTYSTSYTPTAAGTDNIAITLASTGISGSPFTSLVGAGSAAAVVAVSPTTQSATVGTAVTSPPSVEVTDGSGNPVSGVGVTFAVASGGGSVTGGSQVTNASGIATVTSWTLGTTAGTNTLTATATGVATGVTFTATGTAGPVSAAQSTATVPGTGAAGVATSITIQARDQYGNALTTGGATFVVSVTGANTATPAVLDNNNGTYSTSYTPTAVGTDNIAITLASTGISGSPFSSVVGPGAADHLVFTTQPTSALAGKQITPPVRVTVFDAFGNVVTNATNQVTVAIANDPNGGTSVLSGTTVATPSNGIASFSGLSIDLTGTGFTLGASSPGLTGATSNAFDIN